MRRPGSSRKTSTATWPTCPSGMRRALVGRARRKSARRHPRLASPLSLATAGAAFLLLAVCLTVALSLEGRQRQLDARRETALTQYAAFEHSFREAEVLLEDDYAEQIREGVDAGLKALASFGVLDHPDWAQRSPAVDLPPGDRERLTREVGELAFLVAEGSVFLEGESPADKAQGRLLRQLAAACLGPEAAPLLSSEAATETFRRLHDQLQSTEPAENGLSFLVASLRTRHGHYREALPILDRLIQAAPKQYACWYLKGRCHEGLGQAEDALRCYSTCIVIRPDFARPYMARAAVTINHQRDLGRHLTLARADLDEALRLNPRQTTAHIDRSMVLAAQGCLPEALADLDWVLSRPQPPTRVFFLRASVRKRLANAEGARRDRDEGMKRQPTDSLSWITRGVERMAPRPQWGAGRFAQGEKLTPNSFHALNNQAVILGEMQKKHREALAVLDRLVERQPDILVARAARGVLRRLGLAPLPWPMPKRAWPLTPGPKSITAPPAFTPSRPTATRPCSAKASACLPWPSLAAGVSTTSPPTTTWPPCESSRVSPKCLTLSACCTPGSSWPPTANIFGKEQAHGNGVDNPRAVLVRTQPSQRGTGLLGSVSTGVQNGREVRRSE